MLGKEQKAQVDVRHLQFLADCHYASDLLVHQVVLGPDIRLEVVGSWDSGTLQACVISFLRLAASEATLAIQMAHHHEYQGTSVAWVSDLASPAVVVQAQAQLFQHRYQ